jgi:hypothetical protein
MHRASRVHQMWSSPHGDSGRLSRRSSSPDRRRIRLRRWIRLVIGILNAKTAIACAGQLALRPRCEPAVLAATHPAAIVGAPGIDDHGGTWPCTCSQCEDDPGHQTNDIQDTHWGPPRECCVCSPHPLSVTHRLGQYSSMARFASAARAAARSRSCARRLGPHDYSGSIESFQSRILKGFTTPSRMKGPPLRTPRPQRAS